MTAGGPPGLPQLRAKKPAARGSGWGVLALAVLPGCTGFAALRSPGEAQPGPRFVTREELGLGEAPLPLDLVFTIHPRMRLDPQAIRWGTAGLDPRFDCPAAFRSLAQDVLGKAFRSAVEAAPGLHVRIEDLRRALAGQGKAAGEVPPLSARALLLVDFRPPLRERPDLLGQLSVRLYDISCPRYEEMSLFNPRCLIFEDFVELGPLERPSRLPAVLVPAFNEVLGRMRSSDRFQRYLALGPEPLDQGNEGGAFLLGMLGPPPAGGTAAALAHERIEKEILFPPPHPTPSPPVAAPPPAPATSASGRGPAGEASGQAAPPLPLWSGAEPGPEEAPEAAPPPAAATRTSEPEPAGPGRAPAGSEQPAREIEAPPAPGSGKGPAGPAGAGPIAPPGEGR